MDKTKLMTTLYELSLMLYPRDAEELLKEFAKLVMTRFGFNCVSIELPLLDFRIALPKNVGNCPHKLKFEKRNFKITFGKKSEISEKYQKILESVLEKLDQTLEFVLLSSLRRKLLENNEDIIIFVDRNNVVREMNKRAYELFRDLRGKAIDKIWLNEVVRYDGKYFVVSIYDFGFERGIIAKDVTEKVRLEEKLKESEKKFRTLVEIAPFAILVYKDEKWVYANAEAERLLGYSKEELIGMPIWNVIHPDYHEKSKEIIKKRLEGVPDPIHISKIVRKDGEERYVLVNGRLMKWEDENAVIVTIVDITKQKILEERLKELVDNLSLINSILRHDILNSVTSILAYLDVYRDERDDAFLDKIEGAAKRIVDIIREVKELEEVVKNGGAKIVRVREIVEQAISGYDMDIRINGDCVALANESLISVIRNIVENAIRHSGTEKIEIGIRELDNFCEIRIVDYGIGIPDEIKEKIFEKGFKFGKNANTGLGLYIVRKIIERIGGKIWVEDNKPKGSVFVIRLKKMN